MIQIYFNELDPYPAQWLRNLYPKAHVDERSIADIQPDELVGFGRCHFFAGIGGWQLALDLTGWPAGLPVWTGSCPCQPFSQAGRGKGFADSRHLWPEWMRLIRECEPPVVLGEQVASTDGYRWLDLVSSDLENAGYAFGASVLPAACVGAPHGRHRIYFVAARRGPRLEERRKQPPRPEQPAAERGGAAGELAHAANWQLGNRPSETSGKQEGKAGGYGLPSGFWTNADWLPCRDGKWRPVEPGTFPLAAGVPARVGRLRAYGNSIVPQVAALFCRAVLETLAERGLTPWAAT